MPCNCVCAHICVSAYVCACLHACIHVHVLLCMRVCVCVHMIVNVPVYIWRPAEHCLAVQFPEAFLWDRIALQTWSWVILILISIPQTLGLLVLTAPDLFPGCWWFRLVFSCLFHNPSTLTISGISASCAKIFTTKYQCLSKSLSPRPPVFEFFSRPSRHWRPSCFSLQVGCFIFYCPC